MVSPLSPALLSCVSASLPLLLLLCVQHHGVKCHSCSGPPPPSHPWPPGLQSGHWLVSGVQSSVHCLSLLVSSSSFVTGDQIEYRVTQKQCPLLQVGILLHLANIIVFRMWAQGINPDNSAIPYLTALGDLLGGAFLAVVFYLVELTN